MAINSKGKQRMNNSNDRKYPSWLPVILVGMVAWVFALILFNRASWNDWTQPKWLSGDPLEVYARVKIASEQTWLSLIRFSSIERLGAPITANWAAYPVPTNRFSSSLVPSQDWSV